MVALAESIALTRAARREGPWRDLCFMGPCPGSSVRRRLPLRHRAHFRLTNNDALIWDGTRSTDASAVSKRIAISLRPPSLSAHTAKSLPGGRPWT